MSKNKSGIKLRKSMIICFLLWILFVVYTVLVMKFDVAEVSNTGEPVGFSSFNKIFYDKLGFNEVFYKLSKYLGYIALLLVGLNGIVAFLQLLSGKKLKAVNYRYYILGGYYVTVLIFYILFEKIVINYRPLIIDEKEGLEASYPSSHTVLAMCVCLAEIRLAKELMGAAAISKIRIAFAAVIMVTVVLFRFLSGVHWATDILGGVILSAALFSLLCYALNYVAKKRI